MVAVSEKLLRAAPPPWLLKATVRLRSLFHPLYAGTNRLAKLGRQDLRHAEAKLAYCRRCAR